jgi:hypothetical protein
MKWQVHCTEIARTFPVAIPVGAFIETACPLGLPALFPGLDFLPASQILMTRFKSLIRRISLHSFPGVNEAAREEDA